ncbi:trimeric intracellular cation channel family protein [Bremerella sp. T1]|uniref:trimeric intracellular cation channel family protein n=1 Tax=Bremerella sp. TYQ1 TaxID=3119568 RepID=UPI001CC970E1|nr:trimeric intracellular cation channel family protein [Bremerella volcania]UBM34375.1 trimeric intracellular cation channel family protein [Bremerella volcania]
MPAPTESLSTSILGIMYFGEVVFAISGALTAARYKMDVLGFVLIGTITGIGGGTLRDLLLDRPVWWTHDPTELILCMVTSLITFFFITKDITRHQAMVWSDALGLSVFGVVGCYIAMQHGSSFIIAVFMGMVTATGGGVLRDVLTNTEPMIVRGQPYATAALLGSLSYASLRYFGVPTIPSEIIACTAAFTLRAAAILLDIRMGPPGQFIALGNREEQSDSGDER